MGEGRWHPLSVMLDGFLLASPIDQDKRGRRLLNVLVWNAQGTQVLQYLKG